MIVQTIIANLILYTIVMYFAYLLVMTRVVNIKLLDLYI